MKIEITKSECIDRLMQDKDAGWSWEAATALVEYHEELENAEGRSIELDPIAIRCEWSEETVQDIKENYSYSFGCSGYKDTDFIIWLHDRTVVIHLDNDKTLYMTI